MSRCYCVNSSYSNNEPSILLAAGTERACKRIYNNFKQAFEICISPSELRTM